jgi:hypothetical protein
MGRHVFNWALESISITGSRVCYCYNESIKPETEFRFSATATLLFYVLQNRSH